MVAIGPEIICVTSITRYPASGPGIIPSLLATFVVVQGLCNKAVVRVVNNVRGYIYIVVVSNTLWEEIRQEKPRTDGELLTDDCSALTTKRDEAKFPIDDFYDSTRTMIRFEAHETIIRSCGSNSDIDGDEMSGQ
jgi:hypothetical protein